MCVQYMPCFGNNNVGIMPFTKRLCEGSKKNKNISYAIQLSKTGNQEQGKYKTNHPISSNSHPSHHYEIILSEPYVIGENAVYPVLRLCRFEYTFVSEIDFFEKKSLNAYKIVQT